VEIRYYAIIYDLIDDIKGVLSGMLAPIQRETFLGNAEVLQAFDISKVGRVAGCRVTEGVVRKGARVRIVRADVVVLELGTLQTLKRFKDEVNEVQSGQECGMAFAGFQDIKPGDTIECFSLEEVRRNDGREGADGTDPHVRRVDDALAFELEGDPVEDVVADVFFAGQDAVNRVSGPQPAQIRRNLPLIEEVGD